MRVRETVGSLLRRWYIVLFGLLLTSAMCWVVQERVPATYEAKGSMVLMPPSATVGTEGNPYLYLGGMSEALDVLIRHVTAAETVKRVLDDFPDTTYSVQADRSTSGSIVVVSAAGATAEDTLGVLQAALDKVPAALTGMQDELSIADKLRINVRTVVVDNQATKDDQTQTRMMMLAAGAGVVGTLLFTAMGDGFLRGRNNARDTDGDKRARPKRRASEGMNSGEPAPGTDRTDSKRPLETEVPNGALRPRSGARTGVPS